MDEDVSRKFLIVLVILFIIIIIIMAILWGLGLGCPNCPECPNCKTVLNNNNPLNALKTTCIDIFNNIIYPNNKENMKEEMIDDTKEEINGNMKEEIKDIRNKRYCEIFLFTKEEEKEIKGNIYNTFGLNNCPEDCWKTLNMNNIKEYAEKEGIKNVKAVYKNGPRYWTMDNIKSNYKKEELTIGCLKLNKVAELEIHTIEPPEPYTEYEINRETEYTYYKNKPIYILVSQEGNGYIMQSYTTMVLENLTIEQLRFLGKKLKLPEGWSYTVGNIPFTFTLSTQKDKAYVIQDNLKNTYQKVSSSIFNFISKKNN